MATDNDGDAPQLLSADRNLGGSHPGLRAASPPGSIGNGTGSSTNGLFASNTETSSSTNSCSSPPDRSSRRNSCSPSASSSLCGEEEETSLDGKPIKNVLDCPDPGPEADRIQAPSKSSNSVQEAGHLKGAAVTDLKDEEKRSPALQVQGNGSLSAAVARMNGAPDIVPGGAANGNHSKSSLTDVPASGAEVGKACPPPGSQSKGGRAGSETEAGQAHGSPILAEQPSGGQACRGEHTHATASANKPHNSGPGYNGPPPRADVNKEESQEGGGGGGAGREGGGEGVGAVAMTLHSSVASVRNTIADASARGMSGSPASATPALSSEEGAAASAEPRSATPMGGAATRNWVSFDGGQGEAGGALPGGGRDGSGSGNEADMKESWVKFDASPKMPRAVMMPQLTGSSSVHSCDPASEDRQSDVTMSVLSSRGSLSESHDNISREYLPLTPSPTPPPPRAALPAGMTGWIRFEDVEESPSRQRPPSASRVASPSAVQASAAASPPPSNLSGPAHLLSTQQVPRPQGRAPHQGDHHQGDSSKYLAGWVSFDEEDSSASASASPVRSQQPAEQEAAEKRLQLQQLQQSIALQQQQQIQSRQLQQQQQQQQAEVVRLPPYQQPSNPPATLLTSRQHATPTPSSQPADRTVDSLLSFSTPPSTSTPLPGNPFREEMLRQQNRAASPFNPFQATPAQTPSTPGGTVGALWGESPITPGTVSAMWEEFEEKKAASLSADRSPGNPFAASANGNVQHVTATTLAQDSTPAKPPNPILDALAADATLTEQAQACQTPSASQQASVQPISASTSLQGTPVSSQPFQRHTKGTKQVTIRASGKRPKVAHTQLDDVVPDSTPFVDEFPRTKCDLSQGWPMMLRCPDKKRVAGSRFWKPVHVKLLEGNVIQLFDSEQSAEPFRELPLQCSYEFGDRKTQAYDTLGKIHTVKLLYVHYSEKRRYNTRTPYEKVMTASHLLKLGSTDYDNFRNLIRTINEYLMKLSSFRDRGISYKQDALGVVVSDDYRCRVTSSGELEKQSTSVDVTVLAFLSDMPDCSLTVNDLLVKGVEVVSRRDIIPNKTNQWIQLENVELHKCANRNSFAESRLIEFQPLDGCCFSLMRFQTRPRRNMELPLHVKVTVAGEGAYLELRADLLLPGRPGRRELAQITCENIMMRIPIPETWIPYFRREKRLGFYSVKSAHGKPEHIKKGSLNPRLLETSIGSAKYEHAYRAIVWRIEKLPERATVFSASHILMCRIHLASHREVPRTPQGDVEVEFTMPHTTASRTTIRSLAMASDKPSEKRVHYTAHYEYFVEVENKVVLQVLDRDEEAAQCTQQ